MTDTKQYDHINNFLQIFIDSVNKTLPKNLDTETCTKINFSINSSSKISDAESLKENNIIYQLDYTTGERQGVLIVLLPEELLAAVSDILTGGNGEDVYKGTLSEIETNSTAKIFNKIFRDLEEAFKHKYDSNLIFSATPILLLKEMPDYQINSENTLFNFLVTNTLTLSEKKEYTVRFLLHLQSIENIMKDLGLLKTNAPSQKTDVSLLDVTRLSDVKINITAELGKTRVPIKYALELVRGSLVELDTLNNSDIKVFANGVEFANAQVVAVEDNFGLKITKIISSEERLESI